MAVNPSQNLYLLEEISTTWRNLCNGGVNCREFEDLFKKMKSELMQLNKFPQEGDDKGKFQFWCEKFVCIQLAIQKHNPRGHSNSRSSYNDFFCKIVVDREGKINEVQIFRDR